MLRPILILTALVIAVALQASLFGHVGAQSASSGSKDCVDATKKPATDDAKGPDSGGKNMGVTGWSAAIANRVQAARPSATTPERHPTAPRQPRV